MERVDERRGMRRDERSKQRVEQTDRYGNEVKKETVIQTFPLLHLCIYPSKNGGWGE